MYDWDCSYNNDDDDEKHAADSCVANQAPAELGQVPLSMM